MRVAGGLAAAAFAAVADFQTLGLQGDGLTAVRDFEPGEAWASYQRQIARPHSLVARGWVANVKSPGDVAMARSQGKVGAMWTVEGGDFLEGRADRVAQAFADGVRSITLMHYRNNELGDIITGAPVHKRLTDAGVAVVRTMNTVGMLVDVAHACEVTAMGAIEASSRPVIASHVHVQGKVRHARFISRELALAIVAKGGGLVGAWPAGIGITDMRGFIDRAMELVEIAGIDHVCLGTDMDANDKPVFDTYAHLPHFVAGLSQRDLVEGDIAKLIGGNYLHPAGDRPGRLTAAANGWFACVCCALGRPAAPLLQVHQQRAARLCRRRAQAHHVSFCQPFHRSWSVKDGRSKPTR